MRPVRPGSSAARAAVVDRSLSSRVAALALAATAVTGGLVIGLAPAAHAGATEDAGFLAHLNALRAAHGRAPLVETSDLVALATEHSAQMSAQHTIFHNPNLATDVSNWEVVGENVGMGPSVAGIDAAFDASPGHYANEINSSYTQVGIGTAYDARGYLYVTVDFRMPLVNEPTSTRLYAAGVPTVSHPGTPPVNHTPVADTAENRRPLARTAHTVAHPTARPLVRHLAAPPAGTDPLAQALTFNDALYALGN